MKEKTEYDLALMCLECLLMDHIDGVDEHGDLVVSYEVDDTEAEAT